MKFFKTKGKLRSKKGFTLVEMVVTTAVLAITAGMLVGVIASTITKFADGNDAEFRRSEAAALETQIKQYAKAAYAINAYDSATDTMEDGKYYIVSDSSTNRFQVKEGKTTGSDTVITIDYVESVNFAVVQTVSNKLSLEYSIVMDNGYTCNGSFILNNGNAPLATTTVNVNSGQGFEFQMTT